MMGINSLDKKVNKILKDLIVNCEQSAKLETETGPVSYQTTTLPQSCVVCGPHRLQSNLLKSIYGAVHCRPGETNQARRMMGMENK